MHHQYDLSLILACYNEAEIFQGSVSQIIKTLDQANFTYEIIFIDDRSTDNTATLIHQKLKQYPNKHLTAYFHKHNQGRGKTVADGFKKAKGRIVGFIDIDLEIPAWYIPRFVEAVDHQFDGAVAQRVYDINFQSLLRWIFSKGYMWLQQQLLNLPIHDTEAGYKFFKRAKIIPVLKKCHDHRWFWDTEIIAQSLKAGLNLKPIPVVFIRRKDKTSTVKLIPDSLTYLKNLLGYKTKLNSPS